MTKEKIIKQILDWYLKVNTGEIWICDIEDLDIVYVMSFAKLNNRKAEMIDEHTVRIV